MLQQWKKYGVVLLVVAFELLLTLKFYWVSGYASYAAFVLFILPLLILAFVFEVRGSKRVSMFLVIVPFALMASIEVPLLLKLRRLTHGMEHAVASINKYAETHSVAPATLDGTEFAFESKEIREAVQDYTANGKDFYFIFASPDPSSSYVAYSNGQISFLADD